MHRSTGDGHEIRLFDESKKKKRRIAFWDLSIIINAIATFVELQVRLRLSQGQL